MQFAFGGLPLHWGGMAAGLAGVTMVFMLMLIHLGDLSSLGVEYLYPINYGRLPAAEAKTCDRKMAEGCICILKIDVIRGELVKKWLLGLLVVLAVSFFDLWPFPQQDAGELYIVESIAVRSGKKTRCTYMPEKLSASGANIEEALSAMEENTPGQLFLRQTRRPIFCDGAERNCNPMGLPEQLPMGVCVYTWSGSCRSVRYGEYK